MYKRDLIDFVGLSVGYLSLYNGVQISHKSFLIQKFNHINKLYSINTNAQFNIYSSVWHSHRKGVLEKFAYKFDHDYSNDKSETFHFKLHVLFNEYVKIC